MATNGQIWRKTVDGWEGGGSPNVRNATGWVAGKTVFEKTGASTWTQRWIRPTTAPPAPTLSVAYDVSGKKMEATITAAAGTPDIVRAVFKRSAVKQPTSPGKDAFTDSTSVSTGGTYSEFPIAPGQSVSRGTSVVAKVGSTYYFSAWVQDSSFVWSKIATTQVVVKAPPVVAPKPPNDPVVKTASFLVTDSCSWNDVSNYWRTDNNYVYQGGFYWHGLWFYSTRITSALAKAKKIRAMSITIQRVNSQHGVTGAADVYLTAHKLATQIAGNPHDYDTPGVLVGTLTRGQSKTFAVPSSWWPGFLSGSYKGLGLFNTQTSFTDVRYLYAYGAGTTGGKVTITWEE